MCEHILQLEPIFFYTENVKMRKLKYLKATLFSIVSLYDLCLLRCITAVNHIII